MRIGACRFIIPTRSSYLAETQRKRALLYSRQTLERPLGAIAELRRQLAGSCGHAPEGSATDRGDNDCHRQIVLLLASAPELEHDEYALSSSCKLLAQHFPLFEPEVWRMLTRRRSRQLGAADRTTYLRLFLFVSAEDPCVTICDREA